MIFCLHITKAKGIIGANKLPLDYVLRTDTAPANYNSPWPSREEKLKNCIVLHGDKYNLDNQAIYAHYVQHIGSTGSGSSEVNRHSRTRNGRQCHLDFVQHYANRTHIQNKAAEANKTLDSTVYVGVRRNFDIETYYQRYQDAFNKLSKCGPEHQISEHQKIMRFQANIKEKEATKFAISAKKDWDNLPVPNQTFDNFYNSVSADLSTYLRQTDSGSQTFTRRISNFNTNNTQRSSPYSCGGRGRGRGGRGRGRGRTAARGGRGGRGRGAGGRSNQAFNQNNFAPVYGNFTAQAKLYDQAVYKNLTNQQRQEIRDLKVRHGWQNDITPPPGFTIDSNTGQAIPSNAIISAIQTGSVLPYNESLSNFNGSVPFLPPPPSITQVNTPTVPLPINNATLGNGHSGSSFSRSGTRARTQDDNTSIVSAVTINGSPYTGRVYDSNGNPLN